MVSGVTIVATSARSRRPRRRPTTAETPTVVVSEPQASPAQLRFQHPILVPQECDDIALLLFEPTDQRRYDQVQRKHARSLRHKGMDAVFGHYGVKGH
jgi:hypothetical protein